MEFDQTVPISDEKVVKKFLDKCGFCEHSLEEYKNCEKLWSLLTTNTTSTTTSTTEESSEMENDKETKNNVEPQQQKKVGGLVGLLRQKNILFQFTSS